MEVVYVNLHTLTLHTSVGNAGQYHQTDNSGVLSWSGLSTSQTTIESLKHNSLVIGGDSQNNTIDFGTDDQIIFDIDNVETMRIDSAGVDITGDLTVSTNLTVNGTTTTINLTTVTVDDPIITLGGDNLPISDDNKDRGI